MLDTPTHLNVFLFAITKLYFIIIDAGVWGFNLFIYTLTG